MKHLALVITLMVLHGRPAAVGAAGEPASFTAQIEALLNEIQALKDASFVRNGSAYDAKTAVKFLRGKWNSRRNEIASAADFIEKAASVSSTTGNPYLIRFSDGREVKCGDFLKAKLEKLQPARP
jgi:hypothetical protein